MGKNEIHWAVFSGKALLPFSIRSTKKQCVQDFCRNRSSILWQEMQGRGYECKKVIVNEYHH